jgi:hypothetical protein
MTVLDSIVGTVENYRRFAEHEAAGRSSSYQRSANAVAGSPRCPRPGGVCGNELTT